MSEPSAYVGRFAPSPTGPLHFGSLLAAVASYLEARCKGGRWLLRIEDIDPPREQPGASELIINALESYGFEWDGDISYQSQSAAYHDAALQELIDRQMAYPCGCSRRDLAGFPRSPLGVIYPGTCRNGTTASEIAIRIRTTDEEQSFVDGLQGPQRQRLQSESGDFVIRRRDGLIAYHLAVVVDDHLQGVTEIVRGIDLMDSTLRQIWLQSLLHYPSPRYAHIPVAVYEDGSKLSKLTGAPALRDDAITATLTAALDALRQRPPKHLEYASVAELWRWAIDNWDVQALSRQKTVFVTKSTTWIGRGGL